MRDLAAMTATLALWGLLGWGLVSESGPAPIGATEPSHVPSVACVPCTTDEDCAEKNPGISGSYAFPEKAYGNDTAREMNDIEEQH